MKRKWKVAELPTGRYRSFQRRGWPKLVNDNDQLLASLECEDDYVPRRTKTADHRELAVVVYDYHGTSGQGRTSHRLKQRFTTLGEAKKAAEKFFDGMEHWLPKPR